MTQRHAAADLDESAKPDVRRALPPVVAASPGIAGPVTLMARLSGTAAVVQNARTLEVERHVKRLQSRLTTACAAFRGKISFVGEGEMIALFDDPSTALRAACRMQAGVAELPPAFGLRQPLRVAFDRLTVRGELLPPDSTAEAVRALADRARRGQIVTRRVLAVQLPPRMHAFLRGRDRKHDQAGADALCEIRWRDFESAETPDDDAPKTQSMDSPLLRLDYDGHIYFFSPGILPLTLGRGSECAVRIHGEHVSRQHVHIGWQDGQFYLADISLNGTFVGHEGVIRHRVKGDSMPLSGAGMFVCSQGDARRREQWVTYAVIAGKSGKSP